MPLQPGTSLGPYKIESPLGAGGMGEVYKARDTRLDRTVAIKVLPEHVAADPDLKQRFEREARTVAALNHPHICTLYDIGREGETDFLVMEYLDGETVAQRLEKGALPLDQALTVAIEIADALDKAHRQGIVHRDLKPGNIMLTKAGAKLLDFGLAKLKPTEQAGGLSALPTQPANLTQEGAILGTFQYMAPEQLEGQEADARTDIFAFGAVVYEMVTGKKAFEGKSQASLIGAILKDEPRPVSEIQTMSPPALDSIVKTCLTKDPERRWQSIGDVGRQLELAASGSVTTSVAPGPLASNLPLSRRAVPLIAASAVAALITGLSVWSATRPPPATSQPPTRFSITLPHDQRLSGGAENQVALSPSGTYLVYAANFRLYLRAMNELGATPIAGTEGAFSPFFSPDGQWIGFWQAEELKKVAVAGGTVIPLGPSTQPSGVSWGPEDTILYAQFSTGIFKVPGAGGTPELLIPSPDGGTARRPQMLPGGKAVLYTFAGRSNADGADWRTGAQVVVEDLETGDRRTLVQGGMDGRYLPTGHIVYLSGATVFAVPFDLERLEVTGPAVPLIVGVAQRFGSGVAQFGTSTTGSLVYVLRNAGGNLRRLVWVDRNGQEEMLDEEPQPFQYPRLSPEGRQIALAVQSGDQVVGSRNIWVYELERQRLRRLTVDIGEFESPLWSPDGQHIMYAARRGTERLTLVRAADGSGEEETIGLSPGHHHLGGVSPDGEPIIFTTGDGAWLATAGNDPEAPSYLQTNGTIEAPMFSPDGAWLVYASSETGRTEIYVQSFPGGGNKRQISVEGGNEPLWSPDGTEIFYRSGNRLMAVQVERQPVFSMSRPQMLFEGR